MISLYSEIYYAFSEQLWRRSDDGKLLNKVRCWLSSFCRNNYTSIPEYNAEGIIEYNNRGVLGVKTGTSKVEFSRKEFPIIDEQLWHWDKEEDIYGWRHIINKKTNKYLTAEVGDGFGLLSVQDKGRFLKI